MADIQSRPPAPINRPPDSAWGYLDRLVSHLAAGGRGRRWSTRSTCWAFALGLLAVLALGVLVSGLVAIVYVAATAGPWAIASLAGGTSLLLAQAARRQRRSGGATRLRSARAAGGRRRPS